MRLHISNPFLPDSTKNVPVLLFCFEQRAVFMRRRETYEEMINALRLKFNIPHNADAVLRVSTLDVCRGREIEVDEDAYEAMAPFLDEINIILSPRSSGKGHFVRENASPVLTERQIPTAIKYEPSDLPTRAEKVVKAAELFASDDHLEGEKGQENGETNATEPPSSSSQETGHSWDHVEKSDAERPNRRKVFMADQSMVIVKQEIEGIVPPKASGPGGLNMSPRKEGSSSLRARNPSPRKDRYEEPGPQTTGEDPDKHFEVTVTGPEVCQGARLKTRGRYQVKKVLYGVCKSFGIPFDTLIHIVKFVEDGTESVEEFECDNDATMTDCGIKENAQLVVIQREDEDESYDEDEE
ncbi:uncharacterized protein BT62DRAFT_618542 [Guyanagaster necrorhizus]|uniref:Uncharacterized protein n=1 Tax=Guyanagaster necrorhizus TaxID=856835 RepID=A0A9P7W0V1_9AGAR|nr:uncharacterized protein BT62DRAFT_618542 [Guyanagaster necrorhizus MCA 3950]KAG7449985.1 hypothetical protein BT62DRAFT_618542 [Guyanagaster necrorhizus MCA 3950]